MFPYTMDVETVCLLTHNWTEGPEKAWNTEVSATGAHCCSRWRKPHFNLWGNISIGRFRRVVDTILLFGQVWTRFYYFGGLWTWFYYLSKYISCLLWLELPKIEFDSSSGEDEVDVDVFIGKGYFCLPISDIKSAILIYNTTLLPDGWFSLLQVTENRIG